MAFKIGYGSRNGRHTIRRFGIAIAISATAGLSATAANAAPPEILASPNNQAPACATPGRLMAYVRDRNRRLSSRYDQLATHYMRIGNELGIRWDYAFYQMLLETGYLTYKGDVKARQNNFAGMGATGGGKPGESFPSVEAGVRAHLEHLMVYAGAKVANPVSERTGKIQSWGLFKDWRNKLGRPVNFRDMGTRWAPGSRRYWTYIERIATRFMEGPCRQADPAPGLIAGITTRPDTRRARQQTVSENTRKAQAAVERARNEGGDTRSGLGANVAPQVKPTAPGNTANVAILNRVKPKPPAQTPQNTPSQQASAGSATVGRFASNLLPQSGNAPNAEPTSCRVWQASYGGQRAVIIKSIAANHVNYTVLDVNAEREQSEIDAYIAAYARGGETVGRFPTQSRALAKAFELCPKPEQKQ